MRRSTLVIWLGVFLTLVFVYLWWFSSTGYSEFYVTPFGGSDKAGDVRVALGADASSGSLVLFRSSTDQIKPPDWGIFGASFFSYGQVWAITDGRFEIPTWKEFLMGGFAHGNHGSADASVMFPFWLVVVVLLSVTCVAAVKLRRRETAVWKSFDGR